MCKKDTHRNTGAWIAFAAAVITVCLTALTGIILHYLGVKQQIEHEVMAERKVALFDAMRVIDFVFASSEVNSAASGKSPYPALKSSSWDLQLARDAMNRMLIYCENPQDTVGAFLKALGAHNPDIHPAGTMSPEDIDNFRKAVARELHMPEINFDNEELTWIYMLPGTDEVKRYEDLTSKSTPPSVPAGP